MNIMFMFGFKHNRYKISCKLIMFKITFQIILIMGKKKKNEYKGIAFVKGLIL